MKIIDARKERIRNLKEAVEASRIDVITNGNSLEIQKIYQDLVQELELVRMNKFGSKHFSFTPNLLPNRRQRRLALRSK